MAKKQTASLWVEKPKTSRPNIHAKTKSSNQKGSKHYKKKYRGQGR